MKTNPDDLSCALTKREHFAAMFLQGMISNPEVVKAAIDKNPEKPNLVLADIAIGLTNDFINELNKGK